MVTAVAAGLEIDDVEVRYGTAVAVRDAALSIGVGEIVAVIGPSGCGKSTLLRAVAGLEPLHAGRISWAGSDLAPLEAHRRGFGLMFQDHALFPHRDVAANVAFGLRMQRVAGAAQRTRVEEMLALVGLDGFGARQVDELSGGEAQRVALARALAPRPRLVMLDEPLGSLDRSLRERLAVDIRDTIRALGVAALHVTHDQDEAFTVADRVAVMRDGTLVRVDTPAALWREPRHEFVARFVGHQDVLRAAEAHVLGLAVAPADGAVLLPGALLLDAQGPIDATVLGTRFTTAAVRAELRVDGLTAPVHLVVAHGTPPARDAAGLVRGERVRLALDAAQTSPVALDR
jgi:thiamine transport system ATP-binding protein